MRRQFTDEQRQELIGAVRAGGATAREAASRLGVAVSTAYGWLSRVPPGGPAARRRSRDLVKATSINGPRFVRLVRRDDIAVPLAVRVGVAEILVRRGFDEELLRVLVTVLKEIGT